MRNRNQKGLWFPDAFLEYIKGYTPLNRAMEDGLEGLRKILDGIQWSLFPSREVPVASHPGYTSHEHDYFHIEHPDPLIKGNLEKYFLTCRHMGGDTLFDGRDNIADFFSRTVRDLYVYGKAFFAMEWGEVNLSGTKLVLPKSFHSLDALTTRKSFSGGYTQKYSLVTYFYGPHFRSFWDGPKPARIFKFTDEEIVEFKFPFGKKTPVAQTYKKVPILRRFWKFGIDQGKANLEPDDYSLALEKARYGLFSVERRKYALLKAKVRKCFGNTPDNSDLGLTQYYDIYMVARYKKYLNNLRNYFIGEFNEQILKRIAEKNKWDVVPTLTFDYFQKNEEIDKAVQDFSEGKMDVNGFIAGVVKQP